MKYYHITPTVNVEAILKTGLLEGDGRHWGMARPHAVYLTDFESIASWRKELGKRSVEEDWTVLEIDVTTIPWAALASSGFIRDVWTEAGRQIAVGIREPSEYVSADASFAGFPPHAVTVVGAVQDVVDGLVPAAL